MKGFSNKIISAALTVLLLLNLNAPLFATEKNPPDSLVNEIMQYVVAAREQTAYDTEKLELQAKDNKAAAEKLLKELDEKIKSLEGKNAQIKNMGLPPHYKNEYNKNAAEISSLEKDRKTLDDALHTYKKYRKSSPKLSLEGKIIALYLIGFGIQEVTKHLLEGLIINTALRTTLSYLTAASVAVGAALLFTSCSRPVQIPPYNILSQTPLKDIKELMTENPNYYTLVPQDQIKYLAMAESEYPQLKILRENYLTFLKAVADDSFAVEMSSQMLKYAALPQEMQTQRFLVANIAYAYDRHTGKIKFIDSINKEYDKLKNDKMRKNNPAMQKTNLG